MTTSAIGSTSGLMIKSLVDMRSQFDDLQRQLSTGQKSNTYAGLGIGSGLSVGLNAQLSAISGFDSSIDTAMTRIDLAQQVLTSMSSTASTVRSSLVQANGSMSQFSTVQATAQSALQQLIGALNTQAGDRYVFSGRATDTPAVESYDTIMNGDGARAGLKQVISERNQADLGANGLGRLTVSSPAAGSVAVDEDAGPFGLKIAAVNSSLSNTTVTGPSGSPASLTIAMGGQPNAGDAITFKFALPDGTTQALTLTASTQSPPAANQFSIGATAAATASNLQAALGGALGTLAGGALLAASTAKATNDFFAADSSNPPQRVAGPPFDTATALTAGTSADTVIWYTGEAASGSARAAASVRIDPGLTVSYGMRANEDGIRGVVASVAALAAAPDAPSAAGDYIQALSQRLLAPLNGSAPGQSLADIQAELGGVQASMQNMKNQHQQTSQTLTDMLQQITGVSNEEVGARLLKLQTQMQASMQTTAMLLQTSLVNYLK